MTTGLKSGQRTLLRALIAFGFVASAHAQEADPTEAEFAQQQEAVEEQGVETAADAAADDGGQAAETPELAETIAVEPLREEAPADTVAEDGPAVLDAIEVTGSRIRRSDYETAQPVTVVTREDIERTGLTNVGDLLQELPSAGSALNRTFNNGGAGTTEVDLRNLGSSRVLVLVDGRRWVPSAGNPPAVDLNTIPVSIIERIEVLKDGASAIYGSDAITGVVNIITRKDFQGVNLQAQANVFEQGDGLQQQYNASWGTVTGSTSLFFDVNFVRQEEVFAGDRDISKVPRYGTGLTRGSLFTPEGTVLMIPTASNGSILGTELCPDLAPGVVNGVLTGEGLPGVVPEGALPVGGLQLCDMLLKPGQTITGDPSENTATVADRYRPRNGTSLGDDNGNYNY
ncbi:MAG: TonB-dependent receptor plug domain-containing protein, partial [Gammaproteobacteria bacterium]